MLFNPGLDAALDDDLTSDLVLLEDGVVGASTLRSTEQPAANLELTGPDAVLAGQVHHE